MSLAAPTKQPVGHSCSAIPPINTARGMVFESVDFAYVTDISVTGGYYGIELNKTEYSIVDHIKG